MKLLHQLDRYSQKISGVIPEWLIPLALRVSIFLIFWLSAQTKITGGTVLGQHLFFWNVTETTFYLFEYDYELPLIPPTIAAYMATFGEFFLALGVLLGFLTRFSALGLLIMTAVIQFFVYPNLWQEHLLWAGILLFLLRNGAGSVSLDQLLKR